MGSAVVFSHKDHKLWLATNLHVLCLKELADSALLSPVVHAFVAKVTFPNKQEKYAQRFAEESGYLDLAILEVDDDGLEEGRDYLVLDPLKPNSYSQGDDVVVVGNPLGLIGSQSFGHISRVWEMTSNGQRHVEVQIDAAVNPGNSGGPLFVKKSDRFHWIGINTYGLRDTQGLNFAIGAFHMKSSGFIWHPADKWGAAEYIRKRFNTKTVAE